MRGFEQDDGVVGSGFRKVIWIYCVEFLEMTIVETWEQVMARWWNSQHVDILHGGHL